MISITQAFLWRIDSTWSNLSYLTDALYKRIWPSLLPTASIWPSGLKWIQRISLEQFCLPSNFFKNIYIGKFLSNQNFKCWCSRRIETDSGLSGHHKFPSKCAKSWPIVFNYLFVWYWITVWKNLNSKEKNTVFFTETCWTCCWYFYIFLRIRQIILWLVPRPWLFCPPDPPAQ